MKRFALVFSLASLSLVLLAPAAPAAKFKFFQTPSKNIACAMGGGAVRCDIQRHDWPTPPKPPDCDVDYGNGVQVGRKDRASYVCAGDTVFSPNNRVLPYGEKVVKNRFKCASKQKGVRCVNTKSGHGFFLSVQSVRLF